MQRFFENSVGRLYIKYVKMCDKRFMQKKKTNTTTTEVTSMKTFYCNFLSAYFQKYNIKENSKNVPLNR